MDLERMAQAFPPATLVGDRFRIENIAGIGGMGAVFRAVDERTGAVVALKILIDRSESAMDRFSRESKVLQQLDHPGIVKYVAHGQTIDGDAWLAMEWLEGEDLAARLERSGMRVSESLALAARLAGALGASHELGIVHRDIKPSNVFLPGGRLHDAKLLDFGIARALGAKTALTRTGTIMGTPGYMAPEQFEGQSAIDARADVFSLGALLFECLTGKPAFAGEHLMAVIARLLLEEAPRVDELRDDIPPPIADLVAGMLSKDRDKRPRDGRAVELALSAVRHSTGAPPPARPAIPILTATEQRMVCVVVALVDTSADTTNELGQTIQSPIPHAVLTALRQAILALEARVDEVAGTLLVSLSGDTNPSDQAGRAARCALVMRAHLPDVPMVIVTGRGESSGRLPIGPVVDRAASFLARTQTSDAELEEQARATIWLDDVTRALLDVRFDVLEGPAGAELLGEREVGESSRSLLGKATPCVGRERELAALEAIVEATLSDENAHAVIVTGPPGIGKSRIRYEIVPRLRRRFAELNIWVGRADQARSGSAYFLLGSTLRHAAGILGNEPPQVRREKLLQLVQVVRPEEQMRIAVFIGEVAGEPFPDDADPMLRAARLDATTMANEIRRAFDDFMESATARRPICLLLEDLHWADQPSIRFIDRALGAQRERPLCIIALARPEVHDVFPRLFAGRTVDEIRLGELGRKAAERLVKYALGEHVEPEVLAKILDRAVGNAFVLEEMIRAVAEHRSETLPETVLGMVEARLASLPAEQRRALRAASIFGETFCASGVCTLAFVNRHDEASGILDKLVEREVLRVNGTNRLAGDREYSFRHALLREGTYAMLTAADRALGHELAAEWLESLGETDPVVLAEHWELAGKGVRAAGYFAKAAQQAMHLGDLDVAVTRTNRGLAGQPNGEVRAELLMLKAEAVAFQGDLVESSKYAELALELAHPGTLIHTLALAGMVSNSQNAGDPSKIIAAIPILLSVEPTPEARGAFAWPLSLTTDALFFAGQTDFAKQFLSKLERLAHLAMDTDPAAMAWYCESRGMYEQVVNDNPFVAMQLYRRSIELFEKIGHWHNAAFARSRLTWTLATLGDFEQALMQAGQTRAPSAAVGLLTAINSIMTTFIKLNRGDAEEAIAEATKALSMTESNLAIKSALHVIISRASVDIGRLDDAEEQCLAFQNTSLGLPSAQTAIAAIHGAIALGRGNAQEAIELTSKTIAAKSEPTPHGSYAAFAYVTQARSYEALGDMNGARECIREARDWLLARAEKVEDQGMRNSFLERIPEHRQILKLAGQWQV
ncbi:MAG TPA: protein kinase [Polyangium sp.]|nr:protein kinase [Polyangium sp.]